MPFFLGHQAFTRHSDRQTGRNLHYAFQASAQCRRFPAEWGSAGIRTSRLDLRPRKLGNQISAAVDCFDLRPIGGWSFCVKQIVTIPLSRTMEFDSNFLRLQSNHKDWAPEHRQTGSHSTPQLVCPTRLTRAQEKMSCCNQEQHSSADPLALKPLGRGRGEGVSRSPQTK